LRRIREMMLKDKVCLVTGGARGLGRQIALSYAKEGGKIAIVDIDQENGKKTIEDIKAITDGLLLIKDITKVANIKEVVEQVTNHFGSLDVLVNNAGISIRAKVDELTEEQWDRINDINLKAVFFFSQEASRVMVRNGKGVIINMASIRGLQADETHAAYSITKAGVQALTRSFALSLARYGIRVNSISPGYVLTPMTEHNLKRENWLELLRQRVPIGRFIEMQEVADLAVFLASDKSSGITGHNVVIDGGWTINAGL